MIRTVYAVILMLAAARAEPPPNVIVMFADDLGYGDLACYGSKTIDTPHLDGLARDGTRFTNFHVSQAVCSASRASLLTGCYANRIGIHNALGPGSATVLAHEETTLAEVCKSVSYMTGMAGKWHLGDAKGWFPVDHGFDEYLGLPYSNDMWPHHPEYANLPPDSVKRKMGYPELPLIEGGRVIDPEITGDDQRALTARYTGRAVDFIDRYHDRPFFFYLAHSMPHVPLFVSDKFKGKSRQGLFGDVVMEIDWSVGQVMAALEKHGIAGKTLVIFTSDNGPWLSYGDHAGSSGPLREGKGTSFEGGTRVPCIVRWPGHVPAGATSDAMWMSIDLLPTLAARIGANLPALPLDGRDVWPLVSGKPGAHNPHDAYACYYATNELQAVISGDGEWKLVLPHAYRTLGGRPGGSGGRPADYQQERIDQPQLYQMGADIGEKNDVSARHPDVLGRLAAAAAGFRRDLGDSLTKTQGVGNRAPGKPAKQAAE